jgi:Leucine-rich repeat (LRR) protein
LEEFAKSQMNNLRRLNGCSNRIGRLPKMRFLRLEIVYFYGNWLEGIQGFGESELPNLQILKIQNNRIAGKLPVLRFPRMHIAEIGNNQITDFSSL